MRRIGRLLALCGHSRAGLLAVGAVAAAALAPTALANLPSHKDTKIVPFKSIGGVALGDSFAAAKKAWGNPSHCDPDTCFYMGKNGEAVFGVDSSGVSDVYIGINIDTTHPSWKTPLRAFHTSKGIHLGSTLAQIKTAYPHGAVNGGYYYVKGGPHGVAFGFFIDHGRAASVAIDKT